MLMIRDISPKSGRSEAFVHLCDRYKTIRGAAVQDRIIEEFSHLAAEDEELGDDLAIAAMLENPAFSRPAAPPSLPF
jgi:hypothetical protein